MKISRQVGTVSEILNIYIQDATVSTGAGLANVSASSVNFAWMRNNQATVSSGTCSSNTTLGTYSTVALIQVNSTSTLGWYQFGCPDGALASGRSVLVHLSGGPAAMAQVPIEIELTAGTNQAINPVSVSTMATPVGVSSASVNLGISSAPILLGVSTLSVPVGVSSASVNLGISSAPILLGVSTLSVQVGVSSYSRDAGVSTVAVGEKLVGVSTIAVGEKLVGVSTIAVSQKLVGVSTIAVGEKLVGVSTVAAAERSAIADALLARNVSSGGDGGRTVSEALYVLRNKVDLTAGAVYATDDVTQAWTFAASTMPGNPLVSVDPV